MRSRNEGANIAKFEQARMGNMNKEDTAKPHKAEWAGYLFPVYKEETHGIRERFTAIEQNGKTDDNPRTKR